MSIILIANHNFKFLCSHLVLLVYGMIMLSCNLCDTIQMIVHI